MKLGHRVLVSGAMAAVIATWLVGRALPDYSGPASAFGPPSDPPASGWHIGYYTPSGGTLSYAEASTGSGEASLDFTSADNTALLVTKQKAQYPTLLGDLTGDSAISSTFTVSGVTGLFTYYGEPSCSTLTPQLGGPTANVRFFFETSNSGGFDETHYWWSNPVSYSLLNATS